MVDLSQCLFNYCEEIFGFLGSVTLFNLIDVRNSFDRYCGGQPSDCFKEEDNIAVIFLFLEVAVV